MTFRDRALIAALSVALVALSGVTLASSYQPAPGDQGEPGSSAGVTRTRSYVEGVLGHATNASPFGARSAADRDLVALLFRGLVRLGPGNSIVPDLASHWEVDATGARWTFHLRPNLTWDDGIAITSDDVVFTLSILSDPDYTGPGASSWREVNATALDPLTVEIDLDTPLAGFLQAATQPIAPAHLLNGIGAGDLPTNAFGKSPVGDGPFRLTGLDATSATLEAVAGTPGGVVPDASAGDGGPIFATPRATDSLAAPSRTPPPDQPTPYLSGIEFRYYDSVAALRAAWDAGILDAASGLPPADAAALGSGPGARLLRYPGTTLLAVDLDLRASQVLFRDASVRRALLEAIDRNTILSGVLADFATRADSLVPPTSQFAGASPPTVVPYDPAKARAALVRAGWKQGTSSWTPKGAGAPLTIEVLCPEQSANPVAYATAAAVVDSWQLIGLDATLAPTPAAELLGQRLRPGGFEAVVVPLAIGLDPDLYPLLASSQTRTGGFNVSGLQDPSLDKLLAAARAPGSDAARLAAWKALEARLDAADYLLPLAFRDEVVVVRDTVTGPTTRPIGASGDRFWDVLTWRLLVGR